MNAGVGGNGAATRPRWMNYTAAVLIQVALTAILKALYPYLPLGDFPAPYAAALLITVYVFGDGPAILALVLSLLAYTYYFVPPANSFLPVDATGWASVVAYTLVTGIVVFAVGWINRARQRSVRLAEELRESNIRLEMLLTTAAQLLQTYDPQGLVQSLCENVMKVLDCQIFFNFLVDDSKGCLHLNAFAGIPPEAARSVEWLDYGTAICGCAARDKCRIVAEDILNTPDPRADLVKSYGVQAYACHPLLAQGGRVIGTLSFGSRSRTSFTDDELDLMKAVTDQVATAMERIRLLDAERHRAEELQAVLDAVPVAVWIAHDPQCLDITGNVAANQFYEAEEGENVSANVTPVRRFFRDGRELAPEELPMQYAAARNSDVRGSEFQVLTPSGTQRTLWGSATPLREADGQVRGCVAAFLDVTEQREAEAQKREFYRRTILAATEGKLLICERDEIDSIAGDIIGSWEIATLDDVGVIRDSVARLAREAGMTDSGVHALMGCVVEAAGNAFKHAHSGRASLHRVEDRLVFVVSDSGPGIGAMRLPDVALMKGYSTKGTLGMGYKVMTHFADKVYLATGPDGTTVAIETSLTPAT